MVTSKKSTTKKTATKAAAKTTTKTEPVYCYERKGVSLVVLLWVIVFAVMMIFGMLTFSAGANFGYNTRRREEHSKTASTEKSEEKPAEKTE